jgi:biotin-(acetyl-CoA carboxylase) ligase
VEHAIIGFGINVNHTPADLPKELLLAASSLFIELGEPVVRSKLLAKILTEIENALASAFPVACCGASEQTTIKWYHFLTFRRFPVPLKRDCRELQYLYEGLQQGDVATILEEWRRFSATLGRHVRISQRGELREGIAVDVTEEGALLVRVEQDSLITVHAGDIEHLRIVTGDEDR